MKLKLTSGAFNPGDSIPRKYTGDGDDVSPALAWNAPPPGTKELALVCDDPEVIFCGREGLIPLSKSLLKQEAENGHTH